MSIDAGVRTAARANPSDETTTRWAGTPMAVEHWLESQTGFPAGGIGTAPLGSPSEVVAAGRGRVLTERQRDEVLAFAEFLAGRALPAADRAELSEDIVDAFEDSPKDAARHLRPLADGVRRLTSLDPVERSRRRLQALIASYSADQRRRADRAEPNPIMEVVARHNPLVRYWASTGIVLVSDALAARVDHHRLVLCLVGRDVDDPEALLARLVARTEYAGPLEIADLAAAETRLIETRSWLRDMGDTALRRLRQELAEAVASAFDVDIVVAQVGYRAALNSTVAA